ncbi:MAG: cytochrome c [Flavobacteriaceae bacterium]|jgi:cytochrome c
MKKGIAVFVLGLLISCGDSPKEKKGFEYNRTQKEEKKTSGAKSSDAVPVDLENKGVGPITEMEWPENIDATLAATGETYFKQKCTACHMPNRKLIGPAMQGVFERRSPEWVMNMLLNPTEMLKQDPIAKALLVAYNNVMMINQNLSQEEARAITEYLRTL